MLSPSATIRDELTEILTAQFAARSIEPPLFKTANTLWPPSYASWLAVDPLTQESQPAQIKTGGLAYAAAAFPKLTILLDADGDGPTAVKSEWSAIVRQPGRGPTLRLQQPDQATVRPEVFAAVESIWPDLGPTQANRLK